MTTGLGRAQRLSLENTRVLLVFSALLAAAPSSLEGQQISALAPDARLRVTALDFGVRQEVGSLVRSCGDTMVILGAKSNTLLLVPCASLTAVDISVGQRNRSLEGLALGFLFGTGVGVILAAHSDYGDNPAPAAPIIITGMGAAGGALLGLMISTAVHEERWRPVPPQQAHVGLEFGTPTAGMSIAMALVIPTFRAPPLERRDRPH